METSFLINEHSYKIESNFIYSVVKNPNINNFYYKDNKINIINLFNINLNNDYYGVVLNKENYFICVLVNQLNNPVCLDSSINNTLNINEIFNNYQNELIKIEPIVKPKENKNIIFSISNSHYCLPIDSIYEIMDYPNKIEPTFYDKDYCIGQTNYKNKKILLFNISKILSDKDNMNFTKLIILKNNDLFYGIAVDEVINIANLTTKEKINNELMSTNLNDTFQLDLNYINSISEIKEYIYNHNNVYNKNETNDIIQKQQIPETYIIFNCVHKFGVNINQTKEVFRITNINDDYFDLRDKKIKLINLSTIFNKELKLKNHYDVIIFDLLPNHGFIIEDLIELSKFSNNELLRSNIIHKQSPFYEIIDSFISNKNNNLYILNDQKLINFFNFNCTFNKQMI